MKNLIISAEATSDLPKEIIEKYGIEIAPVDYFVDGKEYNTKTNHMEEKEFYEKMKNGADVKTSQVNFENAKDFLQNLLSTGKDVLHISFSSGLSGTSNNFKLACEELSKGYQNKCAVVDSLCASAGQGLLVLLVAKKAEQDDVTFEQLVKYAEDIKLRINHIFTVDDLKYLIKGGRISKTSAYLANILHIKPLMKMDDEGKLTVTQKVFSRKITIKKMFEKMLSNYDTHYGDIFICEANCLNDANALSEYIFEGFGINTTIVPLDYFIGSHSGPGTLSLFYVGDKR